MSALIFTDELRQMAKGEIDSSTPLILNWAGAQTEGAERLRQ